MSGNLFTLFISTVLLSITLAHGILLRNSDHHHRRHHGCDHCPPEWGVVSKCNGTKATVCKPCPPGTWTPNRPHLTSCQVCSRCGLGLYIEESCSAISDTKCGWCSGAKGEFNIDFIKKCLERRDVPVQEQSDALKMFYKEEEKMEESARKLDDDIRHRFWQPMDQDNNERKSKTFEIDINNPRFKPSYHSYHFEEAIRLHKKKVYILLGLAGVMVITTIIVAICFLRQFCCDKRIRAQQQRLYVQLSDEDHHIIHDCAKRLQERPSAAGKNQMAQINEDEWWEDDPLKITENPLEKYLESSKKDSPIEKGNDSTAKLP